MDMESTNNAAQNSFDDHHPELKQENRYSSPVSGLPLYELKMLQEFIHNGNLQNIGNSLPLYKKNLMLLKFFKHNRNQQVEVYSKYQETNLHIIGKVNTIGRDFVILKTLFQQIWIPYSAILSAKTPFGAPNLPNSHQHINFDDEFRRKVMTQFGKEVSEKEDLRQQFFDQTFVTNLRYRKGSNLKVFTEKAVISGPLMDVKKNSLSVKRFRTEEKISIPQIQLIKQARFIPWLLNYFLKV
ncbi:MAG: hypothetical protein ACI35P_07275 [Bacillus sp. (in: firmicutes)]